jgi:cytochrome c oxidase subunit II
MDKLEIKVMIWSGAMMVVLIMALLYAAHARNLDVPACVPYDSNYKAQVKQIDSTSYEIFYVAKMWAFEPAEVYLPVGSEVDLYLTSQDVVHGFHIEKKGVNLMAVPGGINKTTFTFKEPGVYKVVCHEYCGTGHQSMVSEIIVNHPY